MDEPFEEGKFSNSFKLLRSFFQTFFTLFANDTKATRIWYRVNIQIKSLKQWNAFLGHERILRNIEIQLD